MDKSLFDEKLQLQKRRLNKRRPTTRWKKCNPVRKKKTPPNTESFMDKPIIQNSLICKLIKVQASIKENKEKKMRDDKEISKLINAPPNDTAAFDKRRVLAKVNWQGSGTKKPSVPKQMKLGEDKEWKEVQKKDTNNRPSEIRNRRKTINNIINKTSYCL